MSGLKQFLKKSSLLVRLVRWVKQTGPYAAWQYRRDEAAYQRVAPLWEKDRPGMLLLENTNFCNAKCTMCPNPNMRRKKVTMSDELFYKIVDDYDQIGGGVIQVNGTGEPLLDKGLEDKIRYARSKANIQEIVFFSNGALMTAERAASVLAACPHRVSFSIDGLDKESYERVRVGLSWEKVYPHIQGFLALWNEAGRPFEVRIQSMVEGSVAAAMQSEAYQKFVAAGASVNIGSLTDAHDWSGAVALDNSAHRARAEKIRRLPCRRLWSSMSILSGGQVSLCCLDCEGVVTFGDLNTQSILEIWRGAPMEAVRQSHRDLKFGKVPLCGPCTERLSWQRPWGQ